MARLVRMLRALLRLMLRLPEPAPKPAPEPQHEPNTARSNGKSDDTPRTPVCGPHATPAIDSTEPGKAADETEQHTGQRGLDLTAPPTNENPFLAPSAELDTQAGNGAQPVNIPPSTPLVPDRAGTSQAGLPQASDSKGATPGEAGRNVCSQPEAVLDDSSPGDEPAGSIQNPNTETEEQSADRREDMHQACPVAEPAPVPIVTLPLRNAEPDIPAVLESASSFEPADVLPIDRPAHAVPVIQNGSEHSELEASRDGSQDLGSTSTSGGALGSDAEPSPAPTPQPPARYRPRLGQRPPEPPVPRSARRDTSDIQPSGGTLDAELTVTFQPGGWGIALALLLRRRPTMAEEIRVRLGSDEYDLNAIGDDLFEPVGLSDAAAALASGVVGDSQTSPPIRWVRGGRDLHVFTARPGVAGFVSVPRVVIGQENTILCKDDLAADVLRVCAAVGSPSADEVSGPGVPNGWRCFRGIRPGAAAAPENCDAVLLALVPLPDASIEFSGGIPVARSAWLVGHAPSIRILGALPTAGEVTIDGQPASPDGAGDWTAAGWDRDGTHTIYYAGLSRTYEIKLAPEAWEGWEAHTGNGLTACGALGTSRGGKAVFASIDGPMWLVGRAPGEIAQTVVGAPANIAIASPLFEPVWAVPIASSKRQSRQFPRLIGPAAVPLNSRIGTTRSSVRLWCSVFRSAGRDLQQGLEPDVANLWAVYRKVARAVWRRSR